MTKKIKILEYEGHPITFEFVDHTKMINATQMAKPFNKYVADFLRLKRTKEVISILEKRYGNSHNEKMSIVKVVQAGDAKLQGTWMHEKLALKFAAWLSIEFELWVLDTIHEILTNEKASEIELLKWHIQKLTDKSDEMRNLLDTIPFQDEKFKRIRIDNKDIF